MQNAKIWQARKTTVSRHREILAAISAGDGTEAERPMIPLRAGQPTNGKTET